MGQVLWDVFGLEFSSDYIFYDVYAIIDIC